VGRAAIDAFKVTLPSTKPGEPPFEGPLDLLLHLVKEHRIDLFDIPIARITEGVIAGMSTRPASSAASSFRRSASPRPASTRPRPSTARSSST